jgi:hypothetical protein
MATFAVAFFCLATYWNGGRVRYGEGVSRNDELLHRSCLRTGEHIQVRARPARPIPATFTIYEVQP